MTDEFVAWHRECILEKSVDSLKNNGFISMWFQTGEEAREKILDMIPKEAIVGISGSATIKEIGIFEALKNKGNRILFHGVPGLSEEDKRKVQRQALTCDVYISSANAITLDGQIVNLDGIGNRVAALSFGPKKNIIVAGINKITQDLDSAIKRVRNIAAPINAKRFNLSTPCVKTGRCMDCDSPERICNILNILYKKSKALDISVILINQELGY